MAPIGSPSSGSYWDERIKNQRDARKLLGRMDRMEDHAQKSLGEKAMPEEGLSDRDIAFYQDMYQNTYRKLVGVDPSQRDVLREQLQQVHRTGEQAIDDVVDSVRSTIDASSFSLLPGKELE